MTDQNRKTLRSFYCRDYLWEHFEQMAQELGCSMDYLINESMRMYARNRDQSADGGAMAGQAMGQGGHANPSGPPAGMGAGSGGYGARQGGGDGKMNHRTFERVPAVDRGGPPQNQPAHQGRSPQVGAGQNRSGAPQRGPGGPPPPPPRPGGSPATSPDSSGNWQQNQSGPPQPPGGSSFGAEPAYGQGPAAGRRPVYLSFNNNRYVIDQDKYVIGRGSKQTDLTIRDGNISRKHCAVMYRNGTYYIKDLDSTNGVEYRGNRIESKKIEEGDVFYLCDYELRFSYQG